MPLRLPSLTVGVLLGAQLPTRGYAAAQCGKATPFRRFLILLRLRLMNRRRSLQ